ncbi:hypothetical protein K040078D81_60710 [Blautia hominis]|uniref:Uncharacterized protein n=1 Tax=Blautia hominis TaxID=2025493 RepID=A0ABQ0BKH4_9FIRM
MFIIALIVEYFYKNVSRETFFYWEFIGYIVYGKNEEGWTVKMRKGGRWRRADGGEGGGGRWEWGE